MQLKIIDGKSRSRGNAAGFHSFKVAAMPRKARKRETLANGVIVKDGNTVRDGAHCADNPIEWFAKCVQCDQRFFGKAKHVGGGGRKAKYCSDKCRKAANRAKFKT